MYNPLFYGCESKMLLYENTIMQIFEKIKKTPFETQLYEDVFSLIRSSLEEDSKKACKFSSALRNLCNIAIKENYRVAPFLSDLSKRTLLFEAPYLLDSYLQYLEINRNPEEKFYLPRKKVLLKVVNSLQQLVDDELSNLYSAYSNVITNAFYKVVLEIEKNLTSI